MLRLFCVAGPRRLSDIWFMLLGVCITLKLGQNPQVMQLSQDLTLYLIYCRITGTVWVFLTSWQNNKATWRNCLYRDNSCALLPQVGLTSTRTWSSLLCRAALTAAFVLPTARTSPLRRTEIRLRQCPAMALPLSTAGFLRYGIINFSDLEVILCIFFSCDGGWLC